MKKNKLIACMLSITTMATIAFSSVSVKANDVTEGITFKMNSSSTTTNRVVDLYYVGDLEVVSQANIMIDYGHSEGVTVSNLKVTPSITVSNSSVMIDANSNCILVQLSGTTDTPVLDNNIKLGTLSFDVAETIGDITFSVVIDSYMNNVSNAAGDKMSACPEFASYGFLAQQPSSFTVVKELSTTKTIAAKKLEVANTYADEKVDAYTAAIESADADKTINWVLSNAEGKTFTKAANIGDKTAITGEATIVLGLKVFGENRTNVANVVVTVD